MLLMAGLAGLFISGVLVALPMSGDEPVPEEETEVEMPGSEGESVDIALLDPSEDSGGRDDVLAVAKVDEMVGEQARELPADASDSQDALTVSGSLSVDGTAHLSSDPDDIFSGMDPSEPSDGYIEEEAAADVIPSAQVDAEVDGDVTVISDFDPREDTLEIDYTGSEVPNLEILEAEGETQVLLDGVEVVRLTGTPGLDASHIHLIPSA
jgi:hypothetical protein